MSIPIHGRLTLKYRSLSDDGETSQVNLVQSSSAQAYLGKLSDGTIDDFESSCEETKEFNAARHPFRAWVVAISKPPADRDGLILRVEVNRNGHLFPNVGDAAKIV